MLYFFILYYFTSIREADYHRSTEYLFSSYEQLSRQITHLWRNLKYRHHININSSWPVTLFHATQTWSIPLHSTLLKYSLITTGYLWLSIAPTFFPSGLPQHRGKETKIKCKVKENVNKTGNVRITMRRVRVTTVAVEKQHILYICLCVPYWDVTCASPSPPSDSNTFFDIISLTAQFSKKKVTENKKCVLIFSTTFV
jgi:hypothetical protein